MHTERTRVHDIVTTTATGSDSMFPCTMGDGTVCRSFDDYRRWLEKRGSLDNQDTRINRVLGASDGGSATTPTETLDGIPDERKPKKPGREVIGDIGAERFDDNPCETLTGETDHRNGTEE